MSDTTRYAMRAALAALERGRPQIVGALVQQDQDDAIRLLRAALAEPAPGHYQETPGPTIDIFIKIAVPENWENRFDMQWIVEREIHADRWSWNHAAPTPKAEPDERIERIERGLDRIQDILATVAGMAQDTLTRSGQPLSAALVGELTLNWRGA